MSNRSERSRAGTPPAGKTEAGADVGELWREFGGPVKRFIGKRVGNGHDAEDLLQEVFLRAHAALDQVEDRRHVRAWLYRIAANATVDYYRRKRLPTQSRMPDELAAYETHPENLNEEIAPCLTSVMDELPEGYRRALTLADLDGRTQKEVAEELGLSLSGAKSRVQRARRKLKAALLSCCHFELDRLGNVLGYLPKAKACRYCSC